MSTKRRLHGAARGRLTEVAGLVAGAIVADALLAGALRLLTLSTDLPFQSAQWVALVPADLLVRALRGGCRRTRRHPATRRTNTTTTTTTKGMIMYDRLSSHPMRRSLAALAGTLLAVTAFAGATTTTAAGATPASAYHSVARQAGTSVATVKAEAAAADAALARATTRIGNHRYPKAIISLTAVRQHTTRANVAAQALIGAPPTDPESDDPPGPPAVLAALRLDHRISTGTATLFDGVTDADVVGALRSAISRAQNRRDAVLDVVFALPAEGDGADYSDGMADTLRMYSQEVAAISDALRTSILSTDGRAALTDALHRAQATEVAMTNAFGGGERVVARH